MIRTLALLAVPVSLSGCPDNQPARSSPPNEAPEVAQHPPAVAPQTAPAPGDPSLTMVIDPRVCESQLVQYAWKSGTDRVAVEGLFDGACKVVVSREQKGATTIYECRIPSSADGIELRRNENEPFTVNNGRLECYMIAQAHSHGGVTDTRSDETRYQPFL